MYITTEFIIILLTSLLYCTVPKNMNHLIYFFFLQILLVYEISGFQKRLPGKLFHNVQDLKVKEFERWFTQSLDHFKPSDIIRTWEQRYFINTQYYKTGGPVFLMIGGEGEASSAWMTNGAWIDYAKRFGALCFQLEHRYYGESRPTKDLSLENLQYLTSQQALADIASFITAMNIKHDLPKSTKWIAFGGSYPGSLAAWLRLKYPHLVHGAMSASSPVFSQVDYSGYLKVVTDDIRTYSNDSFLAVKQAFLEFDNLLNNPSGQEILNKKFKLCSPIQNSINDPNEIAELYFSLAEPFATVQNYRNNIRLIYPLKSDVVTFDKVCDIMANISLGHPLDRLASAISLMLRSRNMKCLDYSFEKKVNAYKNTSWIQPSPGNLPFFGRQWLYQTCTEFGFYQTSSAPPQIFGNKIILDYFIQQCTGAFGDKYNLTFVSNAIDRTNIFYGGLDIEVTNVVFVHGSLDPWHASGITKTIKKGAPAIFIEGTSHCANMWPESGKDLPQLKAARQQVAEYIATWIQD